MSTLFVDKLKDWIKLIENWLSIPEDGAQIEDWVESAEKLADGYHFTDIEDEFIEQIIAIYQDEFKALILKKSEICNSDDIPTKEFLDELVNRKQIEQRTPEWYEQMTKILSASELGNLFASPRQRAKMVVAKTLPYVSRNNPLAVYSDRMSAFDWGIRFEPVVKQIYCHKYGVEVKELGRMHLPTDPRCTASPDGLVYSCPQNQKTGRLIEIKCPVTREIDGSIPKDYYAQMQMQMQVTGCKKCDYVEAQFASPYNNMQIRDGPALYSGIIALVRKNIPDRGEEKWIGNISGEETKDITINQRLEDEFRYDYGPVNNDNWSPTIGEGEEIAELIPWKLLKWSEQLVQRNDEWWANLIPIIDKFWEDVELARKGEFTIPDSTRIKKPKDEKCAIVFVQKLEA